MPNLPLHHLGIATRDIQTELKVYETLGYSICSDIFTDERQKIRGLFIQAANAPRLELLENLEEKGPLDSLLAKGIKIYHMAYVSKDIVHDATLLETECLAKIFVPIMPATYFDKVCFGMLPNHSIIELVQLKESHDLF